MPQRICQLRFWTFLLLASVALATGCSGLQTPRAEVTSVKMVDQSPDGARFIVTIAVSNPNLTALPLKESSYTVTVPGLGEYASTDPANRTVPSGGVQVVQLPAGIAGKAAGLRGRKCTVEGSIEYEPPGEIRKLLTESYVPLPTVEFKHTGPIE